MDSVARLQGVHKRFGEFEALKGIDLEIPAGICFGLLGPNGAGKTTAIRILQAVSAPTEGQAQVLGMDTRDHARAIKRRIGVVGQEDNLDPDFTVHQNLTTFARFYGLAPKEASQRADALLELVELSEKADARIDALSGGMKRRLVVARALLPNPELLVLDEPTTGLDPQARQNLWSLIRRLKRDGKTVLLTTHYMDEAESLCDTITILDHGEVLDQGAPKELIQRRVGEEVIEVLGTPSDSLLALWDEDGVHYEIMEDRALAFGAKASGPAKQALEDEEVDGVMVRRATLEDVFLSLTGRGLRG